MARTFPSGQFFRALHIDELPQFINVLSGTTSTVGPRPHHEQDFSEFSRVTSDYPFRLVVKPGITGLAQYKEFRGKFQYRCVVNRLQRDLDYINSWSLLLDLALIVKTGRVILDAFVVTRIPKRALRSSSRSSIARVP